MQDVRIICPGCTRRLKLGEPVAPGDRLRCPKCSHAFNVRSSDIVAANGNGHGNGRPASVSEFAFQDLAPAPAPAPPPVASVRAAPLPMAAVAPPPALIPADPPGEGNGRVMLFVAGGAVLLLGLGIVLAVALSGGKNDSPIVQDDKKSDDKKTDEKKPDDNRPPPVPPDEKRPPIRIDNLPPPPPPAPTPLVSLPPEKQAKVNEAIDKGVQFLKGKQQADGSWGNPHPLGCAALPALTLLECGVAPDDPVIKKAVAYVRDKAPKEMQTYDISLAILFLDKLNDPQDRRLIQTLGLRLLAGQKGSGGWTYHCQALYTPQQEEELFLALEESRPANPAELFKEDGKDEDLQFFISGLGSGSVAKPVREPRPPASRLPDERYRGLDELPPRKVDLTKLPAKTRGIPSLNPVPAAKDLPGDAGTDNSNTQFGILGVWVAGRYGLPTEKALALIVKRFRKSQLPNGAWDYHSNRGQAAGGRPTMTCAGLLGLAVGYGITDANGSAPRKPGEVDPSIQKGLKYLSQHISAPGRRNDVVAGSWDHYYLWSVERVAVLYNLKTIEGKDWYTWGVDWLLPTQGQDGSWHGMQMMYGHSSTCLSLLFLKRANLAQDLSKRIEYFVEDIKPERK